MQGDGRIVIVCMIYFAYFLLATRTHIACVHAEVVRDSTAHGQEQKSPPLSPYRLFFILLLDFISNNNTLGYVTIRAMDFLHATKT